MAKDIQNGKLLSQATARFPKIFEEDYRSLIQAAEKSGRWTRSRDAFSGKSDGVLEMMIKYLKRRCSTRERVKSGLIYPAIVGVAIVGALCAFAFYILPSLKQLFSQINTGKDVDVFTKIVFAFGDFAEIYWWTAPTAAAIAGYALRHFWRFGKGKEFWCKCQLRIRGIAPVFVKLHLGESIWLMGTLFSAGVTPQEVLRVAKESSRNTEIGAGLAKAEEYFHQGISFCDALKKCHWIFDIDQTYMVVSCAQKNGKLGSSLENYAELLFERVDQSIDRLVKMIEPAMIAAAGLIVGLIVISYYGSLSAAIANLAAR